MIAHIFKYEIPITDEIIAMELPDNYGLCDIQNQGDKIYMWCVIDIHAKLVKRFFKIVGTGHQITGIEALYFLRTIVLPNGLVWHIFEVEDPKV
jgi:hypothetical protein